MRAALANRYAIREGLRRHHLITDELDECWKTIIEMVRRGLAKSGGRPDADSLIKGEYVQLHRQLFKNLLPEEDFDPKEADREAQVSAGSRGAQAAAERARMRTVRQPRSAESARGCA